MRPQCALPVVLAEELVREAEKFRSGHGIAFRPGHVLFWNLKPTGWALSLGDPSHFQTGLLAVSADCEIFTATGDDGYGGASAWVKIFPAVAQSETKRGSPDQEGAPGQPTKTGEPA